MAPDLWQLPMVSAIHGALRLLSVHLAQRLAQQRKSTSGRKIWPITNRPIVPPSPPVHVFFLFFIYFSSHGEFMTLLREHQHTVE